MFLIAGALYCFFMAKWLTVSDVVRLLHVPEGTIYRWIRQGDIPCVVRKNKYYFNQSTLLTWAESKHIHLEKHSIYERHKKQKYRRIKWERVDRIYYFMCT